jgi:DNA-directed RNA polymerase sigma subunit (sigma70/sigma32)
MTTYLWPGDTGWPTPEEDQLETVDLPDLAAELDLDALSLHAPPPHLFDGLSATELAVLGGRFGLGGQRVRTMKELHVELDLPRQEVRAQLASALEKLRDRLRDD